MLISAIVVEEFGMAPYWLSSRTLMRDIGLNFFFDLDHWFLFGKGVHVGHFPDRRETLFGVGGVQDFCDGIGH